MVSEEVAKILHILAERFGTTIEHLWGVMVKQAAIDAIFNGLGAIVGIAIIAYLIKKTPGWARRADSEMEIMPTMALLCGWIVAIGVAIMAIQSIQAFLTGIFNPEYWALQQVLQLLQ